MSNEMFHIEYNRILILDIDIGQRMLVDIPKGNIHDWKVICIETYLSTNVE